MKTKPYLKKTLKGKSTSAIISNKGRKMRSFSRSSEDWEPVVFYTGQLGQFKFNNNTVHHDDLIEFFKGIDIANEVITTIWACKQKLSIFSVRNTVFAHYFLIVKTENNYWRIDKGNDGIHVKTSIELSTLLNPSDDPMIAGGQHPTGSSISRTGTTILNLFEWIKDNNILQKGYHVMRENCIHFAYILYKWLRGNAPSELEKSISILRDMVGVPRVICGVAVGAVAIGGVAVIASALLANRRSQQ